MSSRRSGGATRARSAFRTCGASLSPLEHEKRRAPFLQIRVKTSHHKASEVTLLREKVTDERRKKEQFFNLYAREYASKTEQKTTHNNNNNNNNTA